MVVTIQDKCGYYSSIVGFDVFAQQLDDGTVAPPEQYADAVNAIADDDPALLAWIRLNVIPHVVSMRQARLQLLALGVYDTINSAISSMGQAAEIEWEYAATVERMNPLVQGMAALLQWTADDLDDYFTAASQL